MEVQALAFLLSYESLTEDCVTLPSLRHRAWGLVYAPAPARRRTPRFTRQHANQRSN